MASTTFVDLSRAQFGTTAAFHMTFPALTVGLSFFLVICYAAYYRTGQAKVTVAQLLPLRPRRGPLAIFTNRISPYFVFDGDRANISRAFVQFGPLAGIAEFFRYVGPDSVSSGARFPLHSVFCNDSGVRFG